MKEKEISNKEFFHVNCALFGDAIQSLNPSKAVSIILLLVHHFQIIAFIYKPIDSTTQELTDVVTKATDWLNLTNTQLSDFDFIAIQLIILALDLIYLASYLVSYFKIRNERRPYSVIYKIICALSYLIPQVLFIPSISLLSLSKDCSEEDGTVYIYPPTACYSAMHIGLIIFALTTFAVQTYIFYIVSVFFNCGAINDKNQLRRIDHNVEINEFILTLIVTVSSLAIKNHWSFEVVLIIYCYFLLRNYITTLGYIDEVISNLKLFGIWIILVTEVHIVYLYTFKFPPFVNHLLVYIICMLLYGPFVIVFRNQCLSSLLNNKLTDGRGNLDQLEIYISFICNISDTLPPKGTVEQVYKHCICFHIEHCTNPICPLKQIKEEKTKEPVPLRTNLIILAKCLLNNYHSVFQSSSRYHLLRANVLMLPKSNLHQTAISLMMAEKCNTTNQQKCTIYKFRSRIFLKLKEMTSSHIALEQLDLSLPIKFSQKFSELRKLTNKLIGDKSQFWMHLKSKYINMNTINSQALEMIKGVKSIYSLWEEIKAMNKTEIKSLQYFLNCSKHILFDAQEFSFCNKQIKQYRMRFGGKHIYADFDTLFAPSTSIIIIDGSKDKEGIIKKANKGTSLLFKCAEDSFLDKSVNQLMPGVYAKVHNAMICKFIDTEFNTSFQKEFGAFAKQGDGNIIETAMIINYLPALEGEINYVSMIRELSTHGVIIVDTNGKIDGYSSEAANFLEEGPISLVGLYIQFLIPELHYQYSKGTNADIVEYMSNNQCIQFQKICNISCLMTTWVEKCGEQPLTKQQEIEKWIEISKIQVYEKHDKDEVTISFTNECYFSKKISVSIKLYDHMNGMLRFYAISINRETHNIDQSTIIKDESNFNINYGKNTQNYTQNYISERKKSISLKDNDMPNLQIPPVAKDIPVSSPLQNVEEIRLPSEKSSANKEDKREISEASSQLKRMDEVEFDLGSAASMTESMASMRCMSSSIKRVTLEEGKASPIRGLQLCSIMAILLLVGSSISFYILCKISFDSIEHVHELIMEQGNRASYICYAQLFVRQMMNIELFSNRDDISYENYFSKDSEWESLPEDNTSWLSQSLSVLIQLISNVTLNVDITDPRFYHILKVNMLQGNSLPKLLELDDSTATSALVTHLKRICNENIELIESDYSVYYVTQNTYQTFLPTYINEMPLYFDLIEEIVFKYKYTLLSVIIVSITISLINMIILLILLVRAQRNSASVLKLFLKIPINLINEQRQIMNGFLVIVNEEQVTEEEVHEDEEDDPLNRAKKKVVTPLQISTRSSVGLTIMMMLILELYPAIFIIVTFFSLNDCESASRVVYEIVQNNFYNSVLLSTISENGMANSVSSYDKIPIDTFLANTIAESQQNKSFYLKTVIENDGFFTNLKEQLTANKSCDYCIENEPEYTWCINTLNGLPQKGLIAVNELYLTIASDIVIAQEKCNYDSDCASEQMNSDSYLLLESLHMRLLSKAYAYIIAEMQSDLVGQYDGNNKRNIGIVFSYLVVTLLVCLLILRRLMNRTAHEMWKNVSLLSVIPLEIISMIKEIKDAFLESNKRLS